MCGIPRPQSLLRQTAQRGRCLLGGEVDYSSCCIHRFRCCAHKPVHTSAAIPLCVRTSYNNGAQITNTNLTFLLVRLLSRYFVSGYEGTAIAEACTASGVILLWLRACTSRVHSAIIDDRYTAPVEHDLTQTTFLCRHRAHLATRVMQLHPSVCRLTLSGCSLIICTTPSSLLEQNVVSLT